MSRKPKGSVNLDVSRGLLRLRLPRHLFSGKQVYIHLGLSDTPINRRIAQAKAQVIEADILFERFDPTLAKYKAPVYAAPGSSVHHSEPSLLELWPQYSEFKAKTLSSSSMKDFRRTANHIARLPDPSLKAAKQIARYLQEFLSANTAKRTLTQINACCNWAVEQELIEENPFKGMSARVKVKRDRAINPFTRAERQMIIAAFEQHEQHRHYAAFVKFLFATGCRTSEAIGLTWQHISPDLTFITFAEVVVEGVRSKSTKTHKIRKFPVNENLRELLLSIQANEDPTAPVFTDKQGNLVRANNFLRRHWQPLIKSLPIAYRPQCNTRHSFITECLNAKVPIAQVAAWVGNSPEIILRHYAGLVSSQVPDFY